MSKKIMGVTVGTSLSPSKIEEKIKPIKTVNNVAPDENGNVKIKIPEGANGKTPYIQDGYWYIDGVNTNVKAEGKGEKGDNGKNAYQYAQDNGYKGTEAEYARDSNPDNIVNTVIENTKDCITEDLKNDIAQNIIAELQGLPVFGVVDENKKIALKSLLPAGNYSMGYNNADGTYTELCIFTVGSGVIEPEGQVTIPLSWLHGKKSTYTAGATYTLSDANNYSASELIPVDSNKTYVSTISKHSYSATNLSYRVIYLDASNMVISSQTLSMISEAVSSLDVPDGCSNLSLRVFSTDAYTDEEICATITLTKE